MIRILFFLGASSLLLCNSCNTNTNNEDVITESIDECKYDDGTHSANVNYHNPETEYSATYTLNVEVEDCQIVQINFPNDGHLDEDHISYADLDEEGNATVYGEGGKTYDIEIDE
jgi:hypothetical protein